MLKIYINNPHLQNKPLSEIKNTDFTLLEGVISGDIVYNKGRKVSKSYYINNNKSFVDLAVVKSYSDIIDSQGFIVGISTEIHWFDTLNKVAITKVKEKQLTISESAELIVSRRKRAINYLQEAGRRLGVGQYIDSLFKHYSSQIYSFIENGTEEFEKSMMSETDANLLQILNYKLEDGVTVKQSILKQIK